MKLKYFTSGLIALTLLGANIDSSFSKSKFKREQNQNSIQVINNEKGRFQQLFPDPIAIPMPPKQIEKNRSFILVYARNLWGKDYKLPVSTQKYFELKQMPHRIKDPSELVNWVTYDTKTIKKYAEHLTKGVESPEDKARLLLGFVHLQMYEERSEKQEYSVKYPLETLVERDGDCKDLSVLFAALVKSLGMKVALVVFPREKGEKAGHVGVGIKGNFFEKGHERYGFFDRKGQKYFYAETTGTKWLDKPANWEIGEVPPHYKSRTAQIYPVKLPVARP